MSVIRIRGTFPLLGVELDYLEQFSPYQEYSFFPSGNRTPGSRSYSDLNNRADCLHPPARIQASFKGCLCNAGGRLVARFNAQ